MTADGDVRGAPCFSGLPAKPVRTKAKDGLDATQKTPGRIGRFFIRGNRLVVCAV
jgi:hypothetical protein